VFTHLYRTLRTYTNSSSVNVMHFILSIIKRLSGAWKVNVWYNMVLHGNCSGKHVWDKKMKMGQERINCGKANNLRERSRIGVL